MVYQQSAKMRRRYFSSVWQGVESLLLAILLLPAKPIPPRVLAAAVGYEPAGQIVVRLRRQADH
jgi:hypothetical protein